MDFAKLHTLDYISITKLKKKITIKGGLVYHSLQAGYSFI